MSGRGQIGTDESHAASRDSGGRSGKQTFDFKENGNAIGKKKDFARSETKLFIVIENSIEGFDPKGVDGSIKDDPMTFKYWRLESPFHDDFNEAFVPVSAIKVAIEVSKRHGFGVDGISDDRAIV